MRTEGERGHRLLSVRAAAHFHPTTVKCEQESREASKQIGHRYRVPFGTRVGPVPLCQASCQPPDTSQAMWRVCARVRVCACTHFTDRNVTLIHFNTPSSGTSRIKDTSIYRNNTPRTAARSTAFLSRTGGAGDGAGGQCTGKTSRVVGCGYNVAQA